MACTGVDGNDSELDDDDEAFLFLVDVGIVIGTFDNGVVVTVAEVVKGDDESSEV